MRKVNPYEMESDLVREAIQKGWSPPSQATLTGKLQDALRDLSGNWNGPLQVITELILPDRELEAAQSLVEIADPVSVYQFLADVYLTDELNEEE